MFWIKNSMYVHTSYDTYIINGKGIINPPLLLTLYCLVPQYFLYGGMCTLCTYYMTSLTLF